MIHNGFLYCDKCGKPIRRVNGMQFVFDDKNDYCAPCAAAMLAEPHYTLFQQIVRWFQGW